MSEVVYLANVRLSFPKLIEPSAMKDFPGSAKKYGADFIMMPDDRSYKWFMVEVGKAATEKWKEHAHAILSAIQNDRLKRCYGKGEEKLDKTTMKVLNGYENGAVFVSANANEDRAPQMVRPSDGTLVDNTNTLERQTLARKLYGGCYVNVVVRPWCQDNQYGRGIRAELLAIQFAKDGDAFGEAAPDVAGMFAATVPAADATPPWM